MRFVKKTSVTDDGEIAEKKVYELDEEQIAKENRKSLYSRADHRDFALHENDSVKYR